MAFEIVINDKELKDALSKTSQDMPKILDACIQQALGILYVESRDQLNKLIYNVPIPVGKNGKPRWVRTRRLAEAERSQFHRIGSAAVGRIYNNARSKGGFNYAPFRNNNVYATGADGVNRTAPWRDLTVQNKGKQALDVFDGKFSAELKERGL